MKNVIKLATVCLSVVFSANALADKVTITGSPITLEKNGEIYMVPETYKVTTDYRYVVVDGKERACFLEQRPDLTSVDVIALNVQIGTEKATWNCYAVDPTYFVIQR